ncbi:MAG: FumA C-terminus/TtdB family hydratase beta subunit, partial [Methanobacteriaceae archaeon]
SVIFHAGPIIKKADADKDTNNNNNKSTDKDNDSSNNDINYEMVAIGPTTSMRMNPYESDVLKMGVKIVIGKGGMDDVTMEALVREKAVYLVAVGGCAALYVDAVKSIKNVTWLDLGMPEAIWNLEVENFGPLIVAMDCEGNSLFDS